MSNAIHIPSSLRQPIKWLHLESVESFARRLLAANSVDAQALRLATAPGLQEHRYRLDDHAVFIEGLAGRPAGHYERLQLVAQPDPGLMYPERFLCRLCASSERVKQIPHDRENWCLRHPGQAVWVGPGTTPESQVILSFDRDLAKVERRFRHLVTAGRVDARLHARVWEMVRDNAWLTRPGEWKPGLTELADDHEVRGRAVLYPEIVAVLEVLSDAANIERWRTRHPAQLREDIAITLPPMPGPVDVLVERIVLWLRPLRREIHPTRIDPLNVPLDIIDTPAIIDTSAPYPTWIQRHPRAVAEWDWSRNDPARDPWDATGVSRKASWVCDEGHSWETSPQVRGQAVSSCPFCISQAVWPGHTDLGTVRPGLVAEWDRTPGVNVGDPDHVGPASSRRANWVCHQGHRWVASINSRSRFGSGCPYCSGSRAIPGETDLATLRPDLAAQWDAERNGAAFSPRTVTPQSGKKAGWRCSAGHSWQAKIYSRARENGNGCPYCANKAVLPGFNDLATTHPHLAEEWDTSNPGTPRDVTAGSVRRASWRCRRSLVRRATVGSRARDATGCPYCCGRMVLKGFNDLATLNPELASQWDPAIGANDRTPADVTVRSNYRAGWVCGRDHTWRTSVAGRTEGRGCPYCAGQRAIQGETDLATLRPDIAAQWHPSNDLAPDQVMPYSRHKVVWQCSRGHLWEARIANRSIGHGCIYCAGWRAVSTRPTSPEEASSASTCYSPSSVLA